MAKRSIEIAISATNSTAGAFEKAKADVQRFANDVKRIQQNARVGGDEFGGGLGQAEAGLAHSRQKAFDLQRIAERSAAERAAWQENTRFDKERYDAIRASVGATDELGGAWKTVTAETRATALATGEGAGRMDEMTRIAARLGGALAIARLAASGIGAAFDAGTALLTGRDWGEALAKGIAEAVSKIPIIGGLSEKGGNFAKALHDYLAGTGPEWQAKIDKQDAMDTEARDIQEKNARDFKEQQLAWAKEFNDRWNAEDERKNALAQKQREDIVKAEAQDRAEREEDNARYRRESFLGLQDEAMTTAELAAATAAAPAAEAAMSYLDMRSPGGGVAAQEAGYLTGIGKYSAEGAASATAKSTAEMAKDLKKLAADLSPFASGEFLKWLRDTGRVPQLANF